MLVRFWDNKKQVWAVQKFLKWTAFRCPSILWPADRSLAQIINGGTNIAPLASPPPEIHVRFLPVLGRNTNDFRFWGRYG